MSDRGMKSGGGRGGCVGVVELGCGVGLWGGRVYMGAWCDGWG